KRNMTTTSHDTYSSQKLNVGCSPPARRAIRLGEMLDVRCLLLFLMPPLARFFTRLLRRSLAKADHSSFVICNALAPTLTLAFALALASAANLRAAEKSVDDFRSA